MARDNFNKRIIGILRDRVTNRCSNPDCRKPTTAPRGDDQVTSIGVAAHICAASPGGPRYDKSMSPKERKSINNAIWLCNNCSTLIDKNKDRYSVNILKEWKKIAEDTAYEELGTKLPDINDAIDTLSMALSGYPKKILTNAIENIHQATAQSLEELDKRINVKTIFNESGSSFYLFAKEEIPIKIKVNDMFLSEYSEKSRELFEHGKELKISSEAIEISGSPIIEMLFNDKNGIFSISPKKIPSIQKLTLVEEKSGLIEQFYDIFGHMTRGSKSVTFTGSACDGIFGLTSTFHIEEGAIKCNSKISINYDLWNGRLITKLPFFERIFSFFKKIENGFYFKSSLEIEGKEIYQGRCDVFVKSKEKIDSLLIFLSYTNRCIKIAERFNLKIFYDSGTAFTASEHEVIAEIVNIIDGTCIYQKDDISGKIIIPLSSSSDISKILNLEKTIIKIITGKSDFVILFGKEFELERRVQIFNSVILKINKKIIKSENLYKLELIPQDDFQFHVFYESDFHSEESLMPNETQS